ncbi:MAG TPA: chemotaxis response regulator protein-glutamate methylesterase [Kofleriaceae bacterium]|nr:chemotaxis response regulator protein-glutamate methylesterase [Kofleriaceae bacterium]
MSTGIRPIRVLVVDDSMFMRAAIKKTLEKAGGFEVVGQARDGEDGVRKALELQPNVITMDYNMPRMNGAAAVREIMRQRPTPVIMFSAHTKQGARETFEALAAGAIDFCTKPGGEVSADLSAIADDLVAKLTAAATSRPRKVEPIVSAKPTEGRAITIPPMGPKVVIIGISTGGPAALTRVIPALPGNTRFATLVVQHMPAQFTAALAERLDSISAVTVREARDGDVPRPGLVLIAPGDRHLEIDDGGVLRLGDGPLVNGCRPSADVTMAAAARVFGRKCIGVVMTGMGKDGTAGLDAIKRADGKTLAQDQESCVIFGMPKSAIEAGVVDDVAPLDDIAPRLRYM